MNTGWFITGTDTEIGKTWATVLLMRELQTMGYVVNGMKPIASGAEKEQNELRNEDALLIQQQCSSEIVYSMINPVTFEPPIAPHIAAIEAGTEINLEMLVNTYSALKRDSDMVLVEGVGGWRVPLGGQQSIRDMVKALDLPVIQVVGLRLGCINHAILTAEAIQNDGMELSGWVLNEIQQDYLFKQHTIDTLKSALDCPYLAEIPHQPARSIQQATLYKQEGFEELYKLK